MNPPDNEARHPGAEPAAQLSRTADLPSWLPERWRTRFEAVSGLLSEIANVFDALDAPEASRRRAQEALDGIEELFLLVVAGEFNAGKSALINALLGDRYLEEGVTPTTQQIQVLSAANDREQVGPTQPGPGGILRRRIAAPLLEGLRIVDTPGTNAIIREHEALTRDFIPRSDLVLFVTSADRPFTETERAFLDMIAAWGKKVIMVVNKADLLAEDEEREQVRQFVTAGAAATLGTQPPVYLVSARSALAAKMQSRPPAEAWDRFESDLRDRLTEEERLRLKLANPLAVVERLAEELAAEAQRRIDVLSGDAQVVDEVLGALDVFESDMRDQFQRRLDTIDNLIAAVRERGEVFLESRFRVRRLLDLIRTEDLKQDFETEVVADAPIAVEAEVESLVDWLVDREQQQWGSVRERLLDRAESADLRSAARREPGGFAARRASLLASVGSRAESVVQSFDPETESLRLTQQVREAVAGTALAEAGAVGLGLVLQALLTTALADATGLLAAGVVAIVGLTIIPHRRQQALDALRERTQALRERLRTVLTETFGRELRASVDGMQAAVEPYSRFIRAERERLVIARDALTDIAEQSAALRREVESAAAP